MDYLNAFGFTEVPFSPSLSVDKTLVTETLKQWQARFEFVCSHKLWAVLTGDVGAGKSTAVRWALRQLPHPEYKPILVTASGGSVLEIYRRILIALGQGLAGYRAKMWHSIIKQCREIASQKVTPILVIDEASLLELSVFKELHTLTQIDCDARPLLSVILVGQEDLLDKLSYPSSRPLASRISARMHLEAGDLKQTSLYVDHHLKQAGCHRALIDEASLTALHQASGGIPRNINNLMRCALITATAQQRQSITPDDIRTASSELFLNP